MKERKRYPLKAPIHVLPGDRLIATITERTGRNFTVTENIGREMTVDTIVTFDIDEPTLGLSEGIGAVFGLAGE